VKVCTEDWGRASVVVGGGYSRKCWGEICGGVGSCGEVCIGMVGLVKKVDWADGHEGRVDGVGEVGRRGGKGC